MTSRLRGVGSGGARGREQGGDWKGQRGGGEGAIEADWGFAEDGTGSSVVVVVVLVDYCIGFLLIYLLFSLAH